MSKSLPIPMDLIPVVKVFAGKHKLLQDRLAITKAALDAAVACYNTETESIQEDYAAARAQVTAALFEAEIVSEDEVYSLDVRYVEDHGHAYLFRGSEETPVPLVAGTRH